jgi:hypothetical protein
LLVPPNTAYLHATPATARRLLGRIRSAFAEDLRGGAIPVDDAIHEI